MLSFCFTHFMSTLCLFQKQLPQMTSSVRYRHQRNAPLTQVGPSSATVVFPSVCLFSLCLSWLLHGRGVVNISAQAPNGPVFFSALWGEKQNKTKQKQTHRFRSNRLSGVWIDQISSDLYCFNVASVRCRWIMSLLPKAGPVASVILVSVNVGLLRSRLGEGGQRGQTLWLVGHSSFSNLTEGAYKYI